MSTNRLKPLSGELPPALIALLLQLAAAALILVSIRLFTLKLTPMELAVSCGLIAAGLSYITQLPRWWLIMQCLFAPALVAALTLDIPPRFYLAAFIVMLLLFWNTYRTQVPLYLSSNKVWRALETLLPPPEPGSSFTFIDIGSGLGGVLTHLAGIRPDGVYSGVESAPLPFLCSWLRIRLGGRRNCQVRWDNFWTCDLTPYDVVFAYLSPAPMVRLWDKAVKEMRPGTLFISSTFTVPGQLPVVTLQVDDLHHSTLLVWRM